MAPALRGIEELAGARASAVGDPVGEPVDEPERACKHGGVVCDARAARGITRELVERSNEAVGAEAIESFADGMNAQSQVDDRVQASQGAEGGKRLGEHRQP